MCTKNKYLRPSYHTCGSDCSTTKEIYVEIVEFTTVVSFWTADRIPDQPRNRRLVDLIKVSAGVYLSVKDTKGL